MNPTKRPLEPLFNLDDLLSALQSAPSAEPGWYSRYELELATKLPEKQLLKRLKFLLTAGKLEAKRTLRPNIVGVMTHSVVYRLKP